MKRVFILLLITLLQATSLLAGQGVERTYLATDREVYVAGDRVWCSAFCVDASTGRLSNRSAIVYLELYSAESRVQTAKIALTEGRGAGSFELPASIPTGNYRLVAYTAQNRAEQGFIPEGASLKTLSVFNVLSRERVHKGVTVVSNEAYAGLLREAASREDSAAAGLQVAVAEDSGSAETIPVSITCPGGAATLSVSVYCDDDLLRPVNPTVLDFGSDLRKAAGRKVEDAAAPEYEGEILRARVKAEDASGKPVDLAGRELFLSVQGAGTGVYAARVDAAGRATFFTDVIFGDRELVCGLLGQDTVRSLTVEWESPYLGMAPPTPPVLPLAECMAPALERRSVAMQIERRLSADTIPSALRAPAHAWFGPNRVRYVLDDYTRFPLMKEVFTEFIQRIRVTGDNRRGHRLALMPEDAYCNPLPSAHPTLVLLDGVPVSDHEQIYRYDPLLVQYIDLYPGRYLVGASYWDGVIQFITYKGNMPGFRMDAATGVSDYRGAAPPGLHRLFDPDHSLTVFWDPLVRVPSGETQVVPCRKPGYPGTFTVTVEGLTESGTPVRSTARISVR